MAVTLPTLQKFKPSSSLPNNERINMQAPNQAQNILSRTEALGNLGEKAVNLFDTIEDTEVQKLSLKAEQDFTQWNDGKLAQLKTYEGDPTDGYKAYEAEAAEKYDEIINSRPDLSERVKSRLDANLGKAAAGQRMAAMKQRGAQQETYNNNIFEAGVKLKKDNLGVTAGYIQKDDPGSFLPFDENIADIRTTIAKRSMEKGTATRLPDDSKLAADHIYKDEEGKIVKVQLTDIAKQRTAKELTEGVGASINSMIASGYTDEAKAAYTRYEAYLDPKSKAAINNKFKVEGVKSSAFAEIGKLEGKSDYEQLRAIESVQDPELKSEMLKIKDTNDRRRENMRKRREDANYETVGGRVLQRMNSENPFHGLADLESDPVYKAAFDRLNVKDKKAVIEMVNAPKTTDTKAEAAIQDLFFGNGEKSIEELSPTEFARYTAGLSKSDKNKYTNMYNRQKTTTAGEERATFKRAGAMLQDQLLIDGHIERNRFGKIQGDDEITLLEARNELTDTLSRQGNMNEKQLKDFVKQFSAAKLKGQVWSPEPKAVFNTSAKPAKNPAQTAPVGKQEVALSPKQIIELKKKFRDAHGFFPSQNDPKFKNFVQNNK